MTTVATPPLLAVVVVSYRSQTTLDMCLQRLRAARQVAEICVIDNGSDDDSLSILAAHAEADARLRVLHNPDNPGFAVACNQGAAATSAPWLVFVNPDCLVEPDSLARLLQTAQGFPVPVLLGCEQYDADGVADAAVRRKDPDFAAMLRFAHARNLSLPKDSSCTVQPVQALSGALMLLPRRLFDAIGGFDEGYRLHAEDLDFCRRARMSGAGVYVANTIAVTHLRGVSSRSRPLFVAWHKHRGLWRYYKKFDAPQHAAPVRFAVRVMIFSRAAVHISKALWQHLKRAVAQR